MNFSQWPRPSVQNRGLGTTGMWPGEARAADDVIPLCGRFAKKSYLFVHFHEFACIVHTKIASLSLLAARITDAQAMGTAWPTFAGPGWASLWHNLEPLPLIHQFSQLCIHSAKPCISCLILSYWGSVLCQHRSCAFPADLAAGLFSSKVLIRNTLICKALWLGDPAVYKMRAILQR